MFVEKVDDETFPELGGSPTTWRRVARSRSPPSSSSPTRPGRAGGSSSRADETPAAGPWARPARRRGPRRRARAAGRRSHRTLTYGPDGERPRRGHAGLRVGVRAAAADARLRRHRLRRRGRPDGRSSSATRSPSATPGRCSRPHSRFPAADEVVVSLAAQVPRGRGRGRPDRRRTVLCVLTHDPKFDVPLLEVALRLPEAGLRRRDGVAAHPRGPAGAAEGGRPDRRRARPGCPRRSGWTSAPAPRRRPRSASPRRSSRCAGAAAASGSRPSTDGSTTRPTRRSGDAMTRTREQLQGRRIEAVALDGLRRARRRRRSLVRPEILRSWERSGAAITPDAARPRWRRGRHRVVLAGVAAAGRGGPDRGGAAPHRRGRRPGGRGHRRRHPDPVDVRRAG